MSTTVGQELTALSLLQKADSSGAYDPQTLDLFVKSAEAYEREIKRVFGSVVRTVKEIDAVTGQAIRTMYIPKELEQQALGVMNAVKLQRSGAGANDSNISMQTAQAHLIETTREIKGTKAQQYAKEELLSVGGTIKHTAGSANKDLMTTYIPVMDSNFGSLSAKDRASYIRSLTPLSNRASIAEQKKRTLDETEKVEEERITEAVRRKKATDRENARFTAQSERAFNREIREREKEEREEEKEKVQSRKAMVGRVGKIATAITALLDVTRRILTSVLSFGSEVSKDTTKARTLELGYSAIRNATYLDIATGLGEGTTLQAQEDLRSKFGNTAKLDTESLKWLAMVMGDEVANMVQSGLGGENPAKLMERILDDFYKRQQAGQDQYGNYVGQDKARRALVTLLDSVSPNIARIFERMIDEQSARGGITSYRDFQARYLPASGGLGGAEWEQIKLLGDEANNLKAEFKNLSTIIKGSLLLSIQGLVGWIKGLGLGKTAEEKWESEQEARTGLINIREGLASTKREQAEEANAWLRRAGSSETADTLFEWATKEAMYGDLPKEEAQRAQRARNTMRKLMASPEAYATFVAYMGAKRKLEQVESDLGKDKVAGISPAEYSTSAVAMAGRDFLSAESYETNPFSFGINLFDLNLKKQSDKYPDLNTQLNAVGFKYADVAEDKKQMFKSAGLLYFQDMNKNKFVGKDARDAYTEAIRQAGYDENTIETMLKYADSNPAVLNTLMDIYAGIVSPSSRLPASQTRAKISGLKDKGVQRAVSYLNYGSNSYGLNPYEQEAIAVQTANAMLESTLSGVYQKASQREVTVSQGEQGEININIKLLDDKGNVLGEVLKKTQGTMQGSYTTSETMVRQY